MIRNEWRLDMHLKSAQMLRQYMEFKDMNVRALAAQAGVSHSTIGHLHSGARNTVRPENARKIEKALGCPPGLLFEARASIVQRDSRSKSPQAVAA